MLRSSIMNRFGLVVCSLWLFQSSVAQDTSCFTNTTVLFDYLAGVADGSDDITVVLCPDTVFSIGNLDDGASQVEGGTMPLIAFPRVRYLCGEDGSSTNNCILENGDIQFWSPPGAAIESVMLQGITFRNATFASILLQGSGQISFIDCIIRDHMSAAPVIIDNNSFRRELRATRELQQSIQNIAFEGCLFADNEQRDPPALFTYGVITVTSEFNTLLLDSCDFSGNVYEQDFGPGTYLVRSYGAPVDVTDSSFCGNSVVGFGLVEVFSYERDLVVENNGGSVGESLTCAFLAVSDNIPEEDRQVTCVPFDAEACEEGSDAPSLSPSLLTSPPPTPEPTSLSSDAPSSFPSSTPGDPTSAPSATTSPYPTPFPTDTSFPSPTPNPTSSSSGTPSLPPSSIPYTGDPTYAPSATASPYPTRLTAIISPPPTPLSTATSPPGPTAYPTSFSPPKANDYHMKMKMMGMAGKGSSSSMMKKSSSGKSSMGHMKKMLMRGKKDHSWK